MLYSFFGTDIVGARREAHEFLGNANVDDVVQITPEHWSTGVFEDAVGGSSLFGTQQAYLVDTPSGEAEMLAYVFAHLDVFADSKNTFVLIEEGLLAAQKKKLEKHSVSVTEVTAGKTERFNVFALSEALLRRDKKSLWMLLAEARTRGLAEEEIVGTLFWQIKSLRLAARAESADEAGMKPFVYGKAKRALAQFTVLELEHLSRELVSLYHDGHRGVRDIDTALEQWVLRL